eukprot:COSAG04_NODE_2791_length_3572_cov_1.879643_4_plen_70_part_00
MEHTIHRSILSTLHLSTTNSAPYWSLLHFAQGPSMPWGLFAARESRLCDAQCRHVNELTQPDSPTALTP